MSATFTPATPYELVEATEHHGPYICASWGTTVCDFYTMSNPSSMSVRNGGDSKPVLFTDAAEHAAFMVKAANSHSDLVHALLCLTEWVNDHAVKPNEVAEYEQARKIIAQVGAA